jgi:hypothetical protein
MYTFFSSRPLIIFCCSSDKTRVDIVFFSGPGDKREGSDNGEVGCLDGGGLGFCPKKVII